MKKAIDWANTILHKPIHLTERTDNEKLLKRIRKLGISDYHVLKSFLTLTMQAEDFALGEFVRKKFSPDVIKAYYTEEFKEYGVNMMGFHSRLSRFFNLGFSIEKACAICVLDVSGCRFDANDFAETVLSMEWTGAEKHAENEIQSAYNEPGSEEPETVHSQFGKIMMKMAGVQENMKSNLSYEEVAAILERQLGDLIDMKQLIKQEKEAYDESGDELNELLSKVMETGAGVKPDVTKYTIDDLDYLILWEEGDSLHPRIEDAMLRLKDFVAKFERNNQDLCNLFQVYTDHQKIVKLIQSNHFFFIRKEMWDYYIENISEPELSNALLAVFSVKADGLNINKLCKAVLNNVDLLRKYIF
ncbi:hypothetical protein KFZ58_14540 [Virgibacillus sp. NKC19-16]|uniref:hypothetical protein n=1 Tax=Virgibacillus salidurans TaxID=2831673 RepID=UPI001F318CE9|nr:hypothetical protein [Virgibacillus sp. NKC19-16]UJL45604.1 hypothetical protein KFZ58_14540 [Virgibacillus sp. NKC19-16]